ncbi:hypothetical protein [Chitinophaga deserti]|uniref:hypothetical protein n=1 Tax=Chitinophaga deserti TaxID=2164099 RepID=UPI000D6C4B1F|nr:hypothetical protein [Chitinophaga deserti]
MPAFLRPRAVADIVSAVLLIFFLHSAIGNIVQIQTTVNVLAFYTPVEAPRLGLAWGIAGWQLLAAVLLFFPVTRAAGFGLSLAYFGVLSVVAWLHPGTPAMFGGLLNHISRFYVLYLAAGGLVLTVAGIVLRYFPRPLKKHDIIAQ